MKIAFPINGKGSLESQVSLHFGRATDFLVYDTDEESFETYANPEKSGGTEFPPDFLQRQEIQAAIVLDLGQLAYNKFKNHNIKMYKAVEGTVSLNLQKFKQGQLSEFKYE